MQREIYHGILCGYGAYVFSLIDPSVPCLHCAPIAVVAQWP
jgi:hypothetical protein